MIGNKRIPTAIMVGATSLEVTTLAVEALEEDEATVAIVVLLEEEEVVVEAAAASIDHWTMLSPETSKAVMVPKLIMTIPTSKRRVTTSRPYQLRPVLARATSVDETNSRPEALRLRKAALTAVTGATMHLIYRTITECNMTVWLELCC